MHTAHCLYARPEAELVQFINNFLVIHRTLSAQLKHLYHKVSFFEVRLKYAALAICSVHFCTVEAKRRLAHPESHARIANLRANHAAHNVAHFVIGTFGFE
ncbi:MAG TPA: hypothetical protein VLF59_02330 [Candidatus Saccharimonadales bacterium]|nr:hypothetical protein [Candidatus Saccharimonadales bacterium]